MKSLSREELKKILREQVMTRYGISQTPTRENLKETLALALDKISKDGVAVSAEDKAALTHQIINELLGLGILQEWMDDPEVTEIMVNGPHQVYVEKKGKKITTETYFENDQALRHLVEKMLRPTGRRLDELSPYVDFSLPDGSRVNAILPPLAVGGPFVTIRKFLHSIEAVEDLIEVHTMNAQMAEFLRACVQAKMNLLFSGPTGSGKTTTLETLSSYIGESERIVTIEDTLELNLRQEHVVKLLTRGVNIEGKGEITTRDLFTNSLRMRPSRIILGEIRGKEALDYLQALNSGHRGTLAVIHASSPEDTLIRLENLVLYSGLPIPVSAIRTQISHGLDLIVQLAQLSDGSRKIMHLSEVGDVNAEGNVATQDVFYFQEEGLSPEGRVLGKFVATGHIPRFFKRFQMMGIDAKESWFHKG